MPPSRNTGYGRSHADTEYIELLNESGREEEANAEIDRIAMADEPSRRISDPQWLDEEILVQICRNLGLGFDVLLGVRIERWPRRIVHIPS
jgi:hypothetical protein